MSKVQNGIPRLTWIYISGAASLFFLVAAILMIFLSPRLTEFGITKSFYYIILIPVGLASAAFLFGALRSSAKYSGKTSYGSIELTGPVVIFCLVVIGGFYFASPESEFLLTIRTVNTARPEKIINEGSIIIDLGEQRLEKKLNENGEIMFPGISSKFIGKPLTLFPQIKGYKIKGSNSIKIPENHVIYLELNERIDSTLLRGMVIDQKGNPVDSVFIDIESGIASATSDDKGRFSVIAPASVGEAVLLTALKNGSTLYRDFITVTEKGSITIKLRNVEQ
ncbi:MAG TPA: hypothetical protein VMT35_04085 [Ignavibacteriaceae bacterium]|nr:hypothetical protein [Ignavibacteriaceae bacterium]